MASSNNPLSLSLDELATMARLVPTLIERITQLEREQVALRQRLPQWVTDEQAQQLTGLSRDTLRRARLAAGSVIIYKDDHGLRYDYDSLLAHNARRALGRGRLAQLASPTPPPAAR